MKTMRLSTGYQVALDGDLLTLVEAIYKEVALRKELQHTYDDVMSEIDTLIRQMTPEEIRLYFRESMFLNAVSYENEMLDAYARRLQEKG